MHLTIVHGFYNHYLLQIFLQRSFQNNYLKMTFVIYINVYNNYMHVVIHELILLLLLFYLLQFFNAVII